MVRRIGGHVIRWGLLAVVLVFIVFFVGNVILTLRGQVKSRDAQHALDQKTIAIRDAQIKDRDSTIANFHVTVTAPPPQVTVTVTTPKGQTPAVITQPGVVRVVPVPSPFAVPGPAMPVVVPRPSPPPPSCPLLKLLIVCL